MGHKINPETENPECSNNRTKQIWNPKTDVDKGWSWLVLAADFIVALIIATTYSGGIFNLIFLEVFDMSKQVTGWMMSVHCSLLHLSGPLSSYLDNRIGPRWTLTLGGIIGFAGYLLTYFATNFAFVFITYGLIAGLGLGITFVPCVSVISIYFKEHRNLAFGVIMTGTSVGTMVLPILITFCANYYGWRGCMLILAGLQLQHLICAALVQSKTLPEATKSSSSSELVAKPDDTKSHYDHKSTESTNQGHWYDGSVSFKSNTEHVQVPMKHEMKSETIATSTYAGEISTKEELYRNPGFLLLTGCLLCGFVALFVTYVHFPAYFMVQGSTQSTVSSLVTIIGVCSILSRLMGTIATTKHSINPYLLFVTSLNIASVLLLCCPMLSQTFVGQVFFAAGFGFYSQWFLSVLPAMTVDMVGVEKLPSAFGIENVAGGIGALIGPPIAGGLVVRCDRDI